MRFLDADVHPIAVSDAVSPLVTAGAISGMTALLGLALGSGVAIALQLFPAVFLGALLAQAGVSPMRTPWAMAACLPVIGLLMAGSAQLAELIA
ncbi:hypothetical protein DWG18_10645 [Lysobacter sp. TY2-98]|uniref:hypothetical protein n=1 Tax=Lysobacter sp. TY2-98 TaxID=2290922 RepID=UPI000E20384E|nr:hypothetical protein [Lysobacter sp. TY2-98]AXK72686.1 hypothetical protein DWG18_10645 [Lysobacter sp. TY2-98]